MTGTSTTPDDAAAEPDAPDTLPAPARPPQASRGFDFTGYKRPSLMRRVAQADGRGRRRRLRRVPRLPRGATRRVRRALQHDPDQRHRLLPRRRRPGTTCAQEVAAAAARRASGPTSRSGSGAPAAPRARRPTRSRWCSPRRSASSEFRRPGEDLRHRRRRGGARRRAPGAATPPKAGRRRARPSCVEQLLRAARRPLRRSARTCAASVIFGRHDLMQDAPISRIDLLVCRNTLMYFNAETQAQDPEPLPLRARRRRRPVPRQGRDAAHAQPTCSRRSTSSAASSARSRKAGPRERLRDRRRRRRRPTARSVDGRSRCASGVRRQPGRPDRGRRGRARSRWPTSRRAIAVRPVDAATSAGRFHDLELSYRPVELRSLHRAGAGERRAIARRGRRVAAPADERR